MIHRSSILVVEAISVARSQLVGTLMTVVAVAGMCAAVLLTTGRAEGARAEVIAGIDDAGTKTIVIRAEQGAGLDAGVLDRLRRIDGIALAAGFGPSLDVTNVAVPGRDPVSLRRVYGLNVFAGQPAKSLPYAFENAPSTSGRGLSDAAFATSTAADELGLAQQAGTAVDDDGVAYTVKGELPNRQELESLGPVVLVPTLVHRRPQDLSVLIVVSKRPELVAPIVSAVKSSLGVRDPSKVTIETSERLAQIRTQVDQQFGAFGRTLLIVVFTLTALFVGAILYGTVMLRRKDFGRRRALGASQQFVFWLIVTQTILTCSAATLLADLSSIAIIVVLSDPLPSVSFIASLNLLALALAVSAALLPALAAAQRDPLKELRVA